MSKKVICDEQDLINIANAIRRKQNSTSQFSLNDFDKEINKIPEIKNCIVTVPMNGIYGFFHYLHFNINTNSYEKKILQLGNNMGDIIIEVVKNSFVYCPQGLFDNSAFIAPDDFTTLIDSRCLHIGVADRIDLIYADNAPM